MSRDTTTGLKFERETDLIDYLVRGRGFSKRREDFYMDMENKHVFMNLKNRKVYSYLLSNGIDYKKVISKQLIPDECLLSLTTKTVYVFEKKFQQTAGSADEKLQTCDFKKKQYQKLFHPLGIKVEYIYILSDWFKQPQYKDVLEYIKSMSCDYRFVDNFSTYIIR